MAKIKTILLKQILETRLGEVERKMRILIETNSGESIIEESRILQDIIFLRKMAQDL